ncbi:zf-HC2 domain-containing protein [Amycolatopsis sp. NPDC005961]|uniref:anti-sigma factor family protein n=1 Tax=Amycolatopsis sp. NPDC005961 TaxID=3156720 RepID=UPI0033F64E8A
MTAPRGWALPESHLLPDAVVAFVDGELSHGARDRAASHITRCAGCAAEVRAQRQTVDAIRRAGAPSMSAGFLASLQSIPEHTDVPSAPDNLAITADGQLVAVQRPDRVAGLRDTGVLGGVSPLGSAAPLGQSPNVLGGGRLKRRAAQGAGVVVSGLVLSALALVGTTADSGDGTPETGGGAPQQANLLPAQMAVPQPVAVPTSTPVSSPAAVPAGIR